MTSSMQKHSCVDCARRKIKCDRLKPCSNCNRSQSECVYRAPAVSQRHRKRPADEDLLSKIGEYEILLRKNDIEFQPLDNSWIASPLEEKLISRPGAASASPAPAAPSEPARLVEAQGSEQQSQLSQADLSGAQCEAARLWHGLPKELRDVPVEQLNRPGTDPEDRAAETACRSAVVVPLLMPLHLSGIPQLLELHPKPKHIFKLWQAFAENVNPLTKVIHTPTLQQRILEASWNLEQVTRPLEAVMFGVYALAVTSMTSIYCVEAFGETRSVLLRRYCSGAAQALITAELYFTRDLEVLQAFVLFLLLDPRSELSVTLVAVATRIGHKMGLHRIGTDPHKPFFEEEMGLRVWWQIIGLESRARRQALSLTSPSTADYGDVRMPMNINDAELHPQMTNRLTVEHNGATEMLYCLMKYDIGHYIRLRLTVAAVSTASTHELATSTSPEGMARKRKILADLEQIYEGKYLCHCDSSIPLHHISTTVARLTIHCERFRCYHPRNQPEGGRHMSHDDQDVVFESSVRLLQLYHDVRVSKFSAHLLKHLLGRTEIEALVYMVSELRQRVSGDLVRTAWTLVERMYKEYPQLLQDHGEFYTALAELTLEAWEARRREIEPRDAVPEFIGVLLLQGMRGNTAPTPMIENMVQDGEFHFGLTHDDALDWTYWNELPEL